VGLDRRSRRDPSRFFRTLRNPLKPGGDQNHWIDAE
jgi:hypothetical protein